MVVYTDDLHVLLLRRVAPFDFWQSVTGSLNEKESPAAAAARELFEETGLRTEGAFEETGVSRIFTIDPRWRDRFPPGVVENLEHEWRYRLPAARDVTTNPAEHSAWRWMPMEQAADKVWSWTNREAIEALRSERSRAPR